MLPTRATFWTTFVRIKWMICEQQPLIDADRRAHLLWHKASLAISIELKLGLQIGSEKQWHFCMMFFLVTCKTTQVNKLTHNTNWHITHNTNHKLIHNTNLKLLGITIVTVTWHDMKILTEFTQFYSSEERKRLENNGRKFNSPSFF